MGPALRRSSYIDDIAHGASTWDQLCEDLDALLYRLRYWNISVSLRKSEVGKSLSKIVKGIEYLSFPSTYKGVQSFLGSLNYYNKFIEDLPVVAAVLYELDEEPVRAGRNLDVARESFEILKRKIVSTPLLRHLDRAKPFVIIPHVNPWTACAVLDQEYEVLIHTLRFTGRVLKESELRYHIAEKEVLAILRTLELFRPLIHGLEFSVVVYTRYSVLKWQLQSNTADGRHLKWGWNYQDGHLKSTGLRKMRTASQPSLGLVLLPETLIPAQGRLKVMPPVSLEMLDAHCQGYVLSFDGVAKGSTHRGSCGCILWKLPGWQVVKAKGHILEGVTLALKYDVKELVAAGDSRVVVQQAKGLINCNQPNLAKYEDLRKDFVSVKLIHVKREFNQAADYMTSKPLVLGESWELNDPDEIVHLRLVSRIPEKIMKPTEIPISPATDTVCSDQVKLGVNSPDDGIPESLVTAAEALMVMTRSRAEADASSRTRIDQAGYQDERWRIIKVHQDEDLWIQQMKKVLRGDVLNLPRNQAKKVAKVFDQFVLDSRDVLYRLSTPTPNRDLAINSRGWWSQRLYVLICYTTRTKILKAVIKESTGRLSDYVQSSTGSGCTLMYRNCASAKGRPPVNGPSPGNIEPRYPFEVVSMDFVTELPEYDRANTYLLLFQDQFSGYVMRKPMRNTEAQDVAEAYEADLLKSKQRATLGYRPQANGQQERSVQAVMRSVRAYFAEVDQTDWDEHADRLMFALNTSFDVARLDTPFYLVHGNQLCDAGSEAIHSPRTKSLGMASEGATDYSYALACAEDLQEKAKRLVHLWHGPFRIDESHDDFKVKLKVPGTGYRVNPLVPMSRLKPRALFPKRDTTLLPKDSWEPVTAQGEYKVEEILDLKWIKRTRTSKRSREYLIK
ncbi:reverse transcriptase [Phytophthora megakarya]|uniref:Reverse transcriptase n=1 Tax=Phytophthora megakarya TaxID=4795 RepID=A0A225WDK7_9STRA|nr:reverse transcriptase [Phytophthora megakarya]